MPSISRTVPHETFEAMRERAEAAELARNDGNPEYDPPILPTPEEVIQGMGGYPQPKWPDDVILPDKKESIQLEPVNAAPEPSYPVPPPLPDHVPRPEAQPEPEKIETSQADKLDGELLAQTGLAGKAQQAIDKIEALLDERSQSHDVGADAGAALTGIEAVKGVDYGSAEMGSRLREGAEALREHLAEQEAVVESLADEVHDAETVPADIDDNAIGSTFKGVFQNLGDLGGKLMNAVEAAQHDRADDQAVIETQADDVYEAETAPVEADEDSNPYDSEP